MFKKNKEKIELTDSFKKRNNIIVTLHDKVFPHESRLLREKFLILPGLHLAKRGWGERKDKD